MKHFSRARAFTAAEVSEADRAAGVKVLETREGGGLLQVRLLSPASREVQWRVAFR